jgi:ABC-2 type transport system permease protein
MTAVPLFRRSLAGSWRSLLGWSLGVAAVLLLYLPLFPAIGGNADMRELLDTLPPELVRTIGYDQITTGAGYTQSTFFGLMGFLLLTIAAVSWGTAAIAGDEENGALELTLAHGVSRRQVVLERSAAVAVRLAWLCLLSGILILVLNGPAGLGLKEDRLVAGIAALLGVTLLTAMVAVAVGALTGRRSFALGAAAGVAVIGYALNAVGNQAENLAWLRDWSPYAWAFREAPLLNGADWGGLALLYGLAVALLAIALLAFDRRDVTG